MPTLTHLVYLTSFSINSYIMFVQPFRVFLSFFPILENSLIGKSIKSIKWQGADTLCRENPNIRFNALLKEKQCFFIIQNKFEI